MSVSFSATIYEYGMNPRVDVPEEISKAFADKGYVSVRGTLNGVGIRATLVPATAGRHVIYVNRQMADRAGVEVGEKVVFTLDRDLSQRKPIPPELAEALDADPVAKKAWGDAKPNKRKQIIAYLSWFSTARTRQRKVEKIVRDLRKAAQSR